MDTLSKVQVMRWMDTNTVKCLQVMRWIDKNRHVATRALYILITPTEQTSYPETRMKLQLMHQRVLLAKEYMNQRLIRTVDQQNWVKMMALFDDARQHKKKYYHIPVFCKDVK